MEYTTLLNSTFFACVLNNSNLSPNRNRSQGNGSKLNPETFCAANPNEKVGFVTENNRRQVFRPGEVSSC